MTQEQKLKKEQLLLQDKRKAAEMLLRLQNTLRAANSRPDIEVTEVKRQYNAN